MIGGHRGIVVKALAEVDAITAVAGPLLEKDVPAARAASDDRATLEALFDRVMADDIPILLPDSASADYRVPGITRAEFRVVTAPAYTEQVQRRLAILADLQSKRMHAAARTVAALGLPSRESAADRGEAGARRTLKHARAYADYPVYLAALRAAEVTVMPVEHDASASVPLWSAVSARIFGRRTRVAQSADPAASLVPVLPTATELPATISDAPTSTAISRSAAIDALAAALLSDTNLRVVEREGQLAIDAVDAPDWETSAWAFADQPAVAAAMRRRFNSPWLDIPAVDRTGTLEDLATALRNAAKRPLVRKEGQWLVGLIDSHLVRLVDQWRGFDALEGVLMRADNLWTAREDRSGRVPTSMGRSNIPGRVRVTGVKDRVSDRGDGAPADWSLEQQWLAADVWDAGR